MHSEYMSCVWYVGLYVTKYVLLIVVTKCVLLKRLKVLICNTGRIDKCADDDGRLIDMNVTRYTHIHTDQRQDYW